MKKLLMIIPLVILLCLTFGCKRGEEIGKELTLTHRLLIIDVHFHAGSAVKEENIPDWLPQNISYPKTNEELIQKTLEMLDYYNIVKVVAFGNILEQWKEKVPERIIPGVPIFLSEETSKPEFLSNLNNAFTEGHFEVLGEIWFQPAGLKPSDSSVKPYFGMAEELDVPIGIHMGPGPSPAKAYWPQYQVSLGNPLLLEDTLSQHPELRLYVMHAGYPFIDEMIGLMLAYPQFYVDISFIDWYNPRAAFHSYLKRLVEAGFEKRIMFGSDYFWSPDIIKLAIDRVESADFLTEEQKRDIFYNNAVRFFRLEEEAQ
ncbi:MAG: amidohydrolase family protein [Candidatus Aminicenantes bacterium]|nr:amidohydrolase family protein [Candidatus Aminicenantes bacterium]MDH5384876.1 amidohydrolase family protein [Candidatus Aminicenantes bacterium]MDH5743190.1 amidohydrolase family protein [Candidatus Aminicenantes bacterium]